jgi:hypothetical protein
MKLAVIGSREFNNYAMMVMFLDAYVACNSELIIVSGGARGADKLSERYAEEHGLETIIFLPDYDKYKKAAPFIRNSDIINAADEVLSFWDGTSNGTRDSMNKAAKLNKPVLEVRYLELQ